MKTKACLCIMGLFAAIIFSGCAKPRQYDFSLKNTLSIFLLDNGKDHYFCIPIQYMDDYQVGGFEFDNGTILIGDYEIVLKRDAINISVYLNEMSDLDGSSDNEFNLMYLEENGKISVSKMDEPLTLKHQTDESDEKVNHYYIFIEKYLTDNDMNNIVNEYKKGNVYSKVAVWYDIIIDNEAQNGSGMLDDFELYNGSALDHAWFPANLNFFKAKYLQD